MSFWKQAVLCVFIFAAAALIWLWYVPGSDQVLARAGINLGAPSGDTASNAAPQMQGPGGRSGGPAGPVITAPVAFVTINDSVTAIGTGRALHSVVVNPFTSGTLAEIAVESGAEVEAGDVIARLDSDSEEIALDRAEIALDDAKVRLERIMALRSTNTATVVQQNDAELAMRNAELARREAALALDRRLIKAPIGGKVGILPISAGNYVTSTSEIAGIDDRSQILVDFWVPERFASLVEVGAPLTASAVARPDSVHEGVVSAVNNRIDEDSRTLRVEARVENAEDRLRAGMAFRISMRFPGETYPAVDPLAIQWSADGPYVWAVKDGVAQQTSVRIVQRNADNVLVDADFAENDLVVTEGLHNVREGAPVDTSQAPATAGDAAEQKRVKEARS